MKSTNSLSNLDFFSLSDLELFEELNDQDSEKISGGLEVLSIQLSGLDNIAEEIKSRFSAELAKKLEESVTDINTKNNLSLICVDGDCNGVVDQTQISFTLKN